VGEKRKTTSERQNGVVRVKAQSGVADSAKSQITWRYALLLIAATLIAYSPALNGTALWDDEAHITRPDLRSLQGLSEIWIRPEATQQYYPVTHSVFWLEHRLWGDNLFLYHLLNVALHLVSAFLLLRILLILAIPGAWFAAAIFALHPVQVESVAWISELKNTLSAVFCLSAVLMYVRFDQSRRLLFYFIAFGLFLLGLGAKTTIAPLPAALLIIFWWKRGRLSLKQDVLPLLPFFIFGIAAGLFTAWVEQNYIGAEGSDFNFSIVERCLIAGRAFWFYLGKLFWPRDLIFVYPRWHVSHAIWWQYLFPATALLLAGLFWSARNKTRGPLSALLLFGGMLFPALGFFNVYPFVFSFVADHFQYIASISIFVLVSAGFALLTFRWPQHRRLVVTLSFAILVLLGALTYRQAHFYRNAETLYRATLQKNPQCWMAHDNLGVALVVQGRLDEAITHYHEAIALRPTNPRPHYDLGIAFRQQGKNDEAITEYEKALELRPQYEKAHNNLGNILLQTGRDDEAVAHFEKALALHPDYAEAHNNLGNALMQKNSVDDAIAHYEQALRIRPAYGEAHSNLGNALFRKNKPDEAIDHYRHALEAGFNRAEVYIGLGDALLEKGDAKQAVIQYKTASDLALARNNVELNALIEKKIARAQAEPGAH
jgi:tetratricopeptide (TPR) repeat protein